MIPKIIHYCWFGGKELPKSAQDCIQSWKKFCPDYEIKRWDESNVDLEENIFVQQAYAAKKYAFVSDYFRFKILEENGGIYLDTDVELIKNIDALLSDDMFMGFEKIHDRVTGVAPGLIIGAIPHNHIMKYMVEHYNGIPFANDQGEKVAQSVVVYMTDYLIEKGLKMIDQMQVVDGMKIYPSSYFCPKDYETGEIHIVENTYSIHHYDSTWWSPRALYLKKLTEKYGKKKGHILYRISLPFNFKLWWEVLREKKP